jgi:hypothetical protein
MPVLALPSHPAPAGTYLPEMQRARCLFRGAVLPVLVLQEGITAKELRICFALPQIEAGLLEDFYG